MTAKRFTINGKEIIQDKQVWCMANSEHCADVIATAMNELYEENEWLFKCVENQSALIHELDSRIMAYNMEHKITIKLTEKDLKTLDNALSYYTHQKVEE